MQIKGKGKIIVRMLEVSDTKERKMMGKRGFFETQDAAELQNCLRVGYFCLLCKKFQ